ncbi:MAG: heparan-alpha-glucosaminide N-acetyltransferase domain-containing protein, partial [Acidobacteriota bacterium]
MALSPAPKTRLGYIDWIRGLACLLMFQTHCYDSWLGGSARQSRFFMYSQLGGTFPAPLFLFVAGISFALVTQRLLQKNQPSGQIARTTILRGAEILGFGLLFRVQEFVISWGWAPKSDLLRVDILNTIGLSMMLMGLVCWMVNMWARPAVHASQSPSGEGGAHGARPFALILVACGTALLISLLTPLLWTIWRPDWLPWPVESYINGVHNLGKPQAWLFPIFPWSAFAFAGLAVGFLLQSAWMRAREAKGFMALGMVGVALVLFSRWVDRLPVKLYPVYDYWHTSPEFFLIRLGMLMLI